MSHQYKSTCLSCGKEWNYTKKDLSLSNQNHRINEMRTNLSNGASLLGGNKVLSAIETTSELPEVAHHCPSCGSKNVSLDVIKDPASVNSNQQLVKFIILCAVVLVSIITISICATVLIVNVSKANKPSSEVTTEAVIENTSIPSIPVTEPTTTPTPASTPITEPIPIENDYIIGSNKSIVRKILSAYKETPSIMGDNALDFENKDLLITVYFDKNDIADGVLFMQNSFDGVDDLTGIGSYVSKHYDELVKMATNNPNIKIESDYTKFNSKGVKKAPMELYIGNIPF